MAVRVDLNISLDGFATTTDQTPENPFGPDWARLTEAYTATRTFRARVLQETSGEGTTGVDDRYAQAYFAEVGAEIMGAGMFGLQTAADDPDWRGWWGDEPPFHVPVFVLTHRPRVPQGWTRRPAPRRHRPDPARPRHPALGRSPRAGGRLQRDVGCRPERSHAPDLLPLNVRAVGWSPLRTDRARRSPA